LTDFDSITHKYGLRSPESRAAISAADTRVNKILEVLKKEGLMERATIFVVSDQGFKPIQRCIRPNAALLQAGLLKLVGPRIVSSVSSADAYTLTAGGMEGVGHVIEPSNYTAYGLPDLKENDQMGDFVLLAKPGYGFIATADGDPVGDVVEGITRAFHGYSSSDPDMDAIFIAWGLGIRPGVRIDKISNLDVAPTVARVLDLKMEHVDGRVLSEILN
jgi:predicted AlkP superfamily pyrophosphatase or phosphodiesterase